MHTDHPALTEPQATSSDSTPISTTSSTPSPPPSSSPTTLLRCSSTADFLAALPRFAGFTAPHSLFVALFTGKRVSGTLRLDLPDSDGVAELRDFVDAVVHIVRDARRSYGSGAPAIVISSKATFAECGGVPWRSLARRLERRLEREGLRPRELCCVAPDGWASYQDPVTPRAGRPLAEIAASPAASPTPIPTLQELQEFLPEATAAERNRMDRALERVTDSTLSDAAVAAMLVGSEELDTAQLALVISAANTEPGWVAIFDQLAATASVLTGNELTNSQFPKLEPFAHGGAMLAAERLRFASERLHRAARLAPPELATGLIPVCAVAWWFRGMQSVAERQIEIALERDPDNRAASVIAEIFRERMNPRIIRAA